MLTFGMSSPILASVIFVVVLVEIGTNVVLLELYLQLSPQCSSFARGFLHPVSIATGGPLPQYEGGAAPEERTSGGISIPLNRLASDWASVDGDCLNLNGEFNSYITAASDTVRISPVTRSAATGVTDSLEVESGGKEFRIQSEGTRTVDNAINQRDGGASNGGVAYKLGTVEEEDPTGGLNDACAGTWRAPRFACWVVAFISSCYWALMLFDMAGNVTPNSPIDALWAPLSVVSFPALVGTIVVSQDLVCRLITVRGSGNCRNGDLG